jgi:hypothetical protein
MQDNRSATIGQATGQVWVEWDNSAAPTKICVYVQLDSVVGDRGFYGRDPSSQSSVIMLATGSAGVAGLNLVPTLTDTAGGLPQIVYNDIQYFNNGAGGPCFNNSNTSGCGSITGTPMNFAGTDIRPEDAEYASARNLTVIPAGQPFNRRTAYGYGNWACITCGGTNTGTAIQSTFSGSTFQPVFFETGALSTDPFSGKAIGNTNVIPVGLEPVVILVSNDDTGATGLSQNDAGVPAGQAGPYLLKNIDKFVASYTFDGILTRTRDLLPVASGLASTGLQVVQRESLSGTYTTFENSVPGSYTVQASQEDSVDPAGAPATWNPLNFTAASGGERTRAIGTSQEVAALAGSVSPKVGLTVTKLPNRIGYSFWSYGNLAPCIGTYAAGGPTSGPVYATNPKCHYLTYDGVDPLFDSRKDNPQGENNPPICDPTKANVNQPPCVAIPFTHIIDGSYGIWNVLRIATTNPAPASITGVQSSLPASAVKFSDFLPDTGTRYVLHSHRDDSGVSNSTARNGNPGYCTTESGRDVGGAVFSLQGDLDWEIDGGAGSPPGLGCAAEAGFVNQKQ